MAKQKQYNKGNLGKAFAFKQTFFDTKGHPAKQKAERPNNLRIRLTYQEKRMIDGLGNALTTTNMSALRIMIFEYAKHGEIHSDKDHIGRNFGTSYRNGYGRRDKFITLKLSNDELEVLRGLADTAQAEPIEMVRIMAHEFTRMITDGTIKRLKGSIKVNESKRQNAWLKDARTTNKPKTGLMKAAQDRTEELRDEAWDRAAEEYERVGGLMEMERANGTLWIYTDDEGNFDCQALTYAHARKADAEEEELYGAPGEQTKAQFIGQLISWGASPLEAQQEWEKELQDRKEKAALEAQAEEHGELFWEWLSASMFSEVTLEEFLQNPDQHRDLGTSR